METIDKNWVNEHINENGEVIIPDGVEKIDAQAFAQNSNVKKVIMPNSVTEIGDKAFALCENLQTIHWSKGLKSIEKNAFYGCKSLSDIELPETLEKIGQGCFRKCTKLEKVKLSKNIKSIEPLTFDETGIKEIDIPNNIESLGIRAFSNCSQLKLINGGQGIKDIDTQAFNGADLEEIEIPADVKKVLDLTYAQNPNLKKVILNENLEYISERAFEQTENLQQIEINGTQRIEFGTFFEKSSIQNISIDGQKIELTENEQLFNIQKVGNRAIVVAKNRDGKFRSIALNSENETIKSIDNTNIYLCDDGKITYAIDNISEYTMKQLEILKEKGINQLYLYGGDNAIRPSELGLNFNLYSVDDLIQVKEKIEEIKQQITIPSRDDKNRQKKIYAQIVNILGEELEYDHWEAEVSKEKYERITREKL